MLITKVCEQSLRKNTFCNSNQSLNCFLDVFLPVFLIFKRFFVYNAVRGKPHQTVILFVVFVIHSYVTKSRKPAIISYAHLICQKQKSCGGIQYSLMINQSISNSPHIPTTPKKVFWDLTDFIMRLRTKLDLGLIGREGRMRFPVFRLVFFSLSNRRKGHFSADDNGDLSIWKEHLESNSKTNRILNYIRK